MASEMSDVALTEKATVSNLHYLHNLVKNEGLRPIFSCMTWERMNRLAKKWLPNPFICHPYPLERRRVRLEAGA